MPTFSRGLEQTLHRALALANERHHEYATLEHLLLALLEDSDAAAVLRSCNVDLDKLCGNLTAYLDSELKTLVTDGKEESQPTAGFQRVVQRAVIHVQSSGLEEVTGANVLVSIFPEADSHAAYFLKEQEMTRYDAIAFISHGIKKKPGVSEEDFLSEVEEEVGNMRSVWVPFRAHERRISALERIIGRLTVEIELVNEELKKATRNSTRSAAKKAAGKHRRRGS